VQADARDADSRHSQVPDDPAKDRTGVLTTVVALVQQLPTSVKSQQKVMETAVTLAGEKGKELPLGGRFLFQRFL
jgi:hypothetical protein